MCFVTRSGNHGKAAFTNISSGELNIASVHTFSFGKLVKPAKSTSTHTINKPLTRPNITPKKRLSQPKFILLTILEIATDSRIFINRTTISNIKKATSIFNASVGMSCGNNGANCAE